MFNCFSYKSVKFYSLIMCIIFVASLISCSKENELLKIGATVWPGYEPLYLARETGFIEKNQFHMVEYLSASQVMQSYRNDVIDIAALTMDEVLVLIGEGFDPVVILVLDSSFGADAIIAKPKYKNIVDLKNKRIGYEGTALGAYVLSRALHKNNLKADDVELVLMNVNETERELKRGGVEAVVTFEPSRSRLLESGYREIFNSKEIPNEIVDVLVVKREVANKNKKQLKNLVNGWFKSVEYMNYDKKKSMAIINRRLKLSEEGLAKAFDDIVFPNRNENLAMLGNDDAKGSLIGVTHKIIKNMRQLKLLDGGVVLDGVFDSKFITE